MKKHVLIATTSHSTKGNTGEPTGAYLPEVAHPYDVFIRAGYTVEFASVKGGSIPLDGVKDADAQSNAFFASPHARTRAQPGCESSRSGQV